MYADFTVPLHVEPVKYQRSAQARVGQTKNSGNTPEGAFPLLSLEEMTRFKAGLCRKSPANTYREPEARSVRL